jgi:hypothetical protein
MNIEIDDLNKKQYAIMSGILASHKLGFKYHVIQAGRKSGKSYLLTRMAMYLSAKPLQNGAIICAYSRQNNSIYNSLVNKIPVEYYSEVFAKDFVRTKEATTIRFINNSTISFFTAKNPDAFVNESFDWMVCDEMALWPLNSWEVQIEPTLLAKPRAVAILASTPRGKNDFFKLVMQGKDDENDMVKHYTMTYHDNKNIDLRQIEKARISSSEFAFKQEYLGEFVFGASSVFGDFIKNQLVICWEDPIEGEKYYHGIDWSGGGELGDSTLLTILNSKGKVVYMYEAKSDRMMEQCKELAEIIHRYHSIGYSEFNGLGRMATETMQDLKTNTYKFNTSNESKQEAVAFLIKDLNLSQVQLPTAELFPKLDNEMTTFEVKRTALGKLQYAHTKGGHDDSVDSLWLSNKARHDSLDFKTEYAEEDKDIPTNEQIIEDDFYGNNDNLW